VNSLAKFVVLISVVTAGFLAKAEAPIEAPAGDAPSSGLLDTEFFHQADGGMFEVSPYIVITGKKYKFRNESTESNYGNFDLGSRFEYGLTPWLSLGLDLVYSLGAVSYDEEPTGTNYKDYTVQGLKDPAVDLRARIPAGPGVVNLKAQVSTALEKFKEDSDGDLNVASGGTTVNAGVGYSVGLGAHKFGGGFDYDVVQTERQSKNSATNFKTKGGNALSVSGFYEFSFPKLATIGGSVSYIDIAAVKSNETGTYKSLDSQSQAYVVSVYGPLRFTDRITLVPILAVGGQKFTSKSFQSKNATISSIGCMGRFAF
jgi:hypothetical protein